MAKYMLWIEGYQASGDSSGAIYLADVVGPTFDQAVQKYVDSLTPRDKVYWNKSKKGWSYWGCRAFDNEKDARRSFG